ncbi:MAG: energy transducer TonB [Sphingomonadales bacterium 63-6]|nr:MAG: energy transducer TonB [Sphingomonadales bacterium 63-6]
MAYADQTMSGNKIVAIIIVGLVHLLVGYALVTGLAYSATKKLIERVTTVDIDEPEPEKTEEPPPPPPDEAPPPPIVAPPPPININVAPPPVTVVDRPPPPAPVIPIARPAPPAPPAPPPAVSKARGVEPKGQSRWAARIQENYPARAVRSGTEGTVGVSVTVGADGKVAACRVSNSSGSDVLDEAACDGMQRYARFDPALDDAGNPTSASWSTRIVYKLN